MKKFSSKKRGLLLLKTTLTILFALCVGLFASCRKEIDYMDYVSELRSNIFLASGQGLSLRIYAVSKETPYATDGIPKECSTRVEAYLVAPEGDKTCKISFPFDGKEYGGEMSFDNVKTEYYFSCTLDISKASELPCRIEYGDTALEMNALSIRTEDTLTPQNILKNLQTEEAELFASLTDEYGFAGEIYIRLIYEDSPYYYVGIIDRNGQIHAFLLNATTGKILAKRTSQ